MTQKRSGNTSLKSFRRSVHRNFLSHIDISRKCDIMSAMDTRDILKALDNDIRLQILGWLKQPKKEFSVQADQMPEGKDFEGGVCVGCICEKAGVSQSTASHYLDILQRAGLVESRRIGKWTYYRRNEETIRQFAEYIKNEL